MHLVDRMKEMAKKLTEESLSEVSKQSSDEKKVPDPESGHGFLEAVREEISLPNHDGSSGEATVEDVVRDLAQRKKKGEMPRNPREALLDALGKCPPSEAFATSAVFDLSRRYRDHFMKALKASSDSDLFRLFRSVFSLFLDQPELSGVDPSSLNKGNDDTDPMKWEISGIALPDGAYAALCLMPVAEKALFCRLCGIVFSSAGDEYYSCMLKKSESKPSPVMSHPVNLPPVQAGQLISPGPDLKERFLACIIQYRSAAPVSR